MASGSQHCKNTDSEKPLPSVIQFTQSLDIMPTLRVFASFGQWYPEELQSRSCQVAGDVTLNDCSPALSTVMPNRQKMLSSGKRVSSTSASKSEANCRKKESACEQRRPRSRVEMEQRKTKTGTSSAVWLSSKYNRASLGNNVSFEKSNSRSPKINTPHRTADMYSDRHVPAGRHRMSSCSVKKSVTVARDDQSYKRHTRQPNRSDVWKSVTSNDATKNCWSSSETEHSFETCTADVTVNMFHSTAVSTYRAVEGTKEAMNYVVKIQPLLVWKDVFAAGSSECCGDLLEAEMSGGGMGDSKALIKCEVQGGTEGFESGLELPSADNNNIESTPLNRDDICKLSCGYAIDNTKMKNLVDNCHSGCLQHDHVDDTPISMLGTCSNRLGIDIDNYLKEMGHYNETHRHTNFLTGDMSTVRTFNPRRCFSSDNLCITASVDGSLSRRLSCSTDALFAGNPVCTRPTAAQYDCGGRNSAAVKGAVPPGSQGDADCLRLPAVTWSNDAALTDASQLLLTSADHSEIGRQALPSPLTDDLYRRAGALCCAGIETVRTMECVQHGPFQSNVISCGVVDGGRLATAETGLGWQPHQWTAVADKFAALGVPQRFTADIPTVACCAAGEDSALYFSELPLRLSAYPSDRSRSDLVMGQVASSTDDVNMQKNAAVESLDISSTLAVSIGGAAHVRSRSTGHLESVGWDSLLNPAHSGASVGHVLPTCGVEAAKRSTTATASEADNEDDVGGQLTADTLGWSSTDESQQAPRGLRELRPTACEDELRLATRQQADVCARDSVDNQSTSSSAAERDVQTVDDSTETYCREGDDTDAVLCCDDDKDEELEVEFTDEDDRWHQSRVTDEVVRRSRSSPLCVEPDSAVNSSQQDSHLSAEQSPAPLLSCAGHADDATRPPAAEARDARASAAVSAGVTDEGLAGGRTLEASLLNPALAAAATAPVSEAPSLSNTDHRPAYEVGKPTGNIPVSDDGQVENVVETNLVGASMASDVTCADAISIARPPACSGEAFSKSPDSDHMSSDSAVMKFSRSLSSGIAPDDDDVDRKLADELERLKNLVVSSPKNYSDPTATVVSHRLDDSSSSMPDPEECSVNSMDDASDFSSSDNKHSFHLPFAATETADSVVECADIELSYTDRLGDTVTGLCTQCRDGSADGKEPDSFADNIDSVPVSSEPTIDSLPPAVSTVEHQQATCKVSYTKQHNAAVSKHSRLDASMLAYDVSQPVSHANSDAVDIVMNSAANSALADVILEAEQSLYSFLGVRYNAASSNSSNDLSKCDTACSSSSILPDTVQDSQTFGHDATDFAEPSNHKSLNCNNSHSFCTCPFQNYYLKLARNVILGNRMHDLSVRGSIGDEGEERNEMTWNELKVLVEMLYAEQRVLAQVDSTSLHLQVAYCTLFMHLE